MNCQVIPLRIKRTLLSVAVSATPFAALQVSAQESNSDLVIDEIIITVERREQNLQDFAGTVQAFTAEDLDRIGVNGDFRNLANAVSGLHISNQEGKIEVYLRGIGSSDSDFASDPSVATHYNGVYLPRPRSIGPMFFDVERVEVNKGPQGTVRGRNATGGTINIISKKPDLDAFSGSITAAAGDYDLQTIETVLNIPLSDTLAIRAAILDEAHDPYLDNAYGGNPPTNLNTQLGDGSMDAPGAVDDRAIRLSAVWEPNDQFSAYFLADKVKQRGSGTPGAFSGRALSAGFDIDDLHDPYEQYFLDEGEVENDIKGFSTSLTYDIGGVALEYNGSYRNYEFYNMNAPREWQVGMVYPGSELESQTAAAYGRFTQAENSTTKVHEIRTYSTGEGALSWSAGAFYLEEEYDYLSRDFTHGWWGDCDWFQPGTVCGWLNGLSGENRGDDSEVTSTAVYFDGTYDLTDKTRLKSGIRWSEDEKVANEKNANYQLVLDDAALASLGLTGPQDLIMGSNGIELTGAGERSIDNVPLGNSPATLAYFLDGIDAWGGQDNVDDVIASDPSLAQVVITSDFPGGELTNKYKDDYVDWRIGFEHDLSADQMIYGTVSTGTRSGGINRPLVLGDGTQLARTWDPEKLRVYELGSKYELTWQALPVRLNTAIFYYDYKDKVIQNLVAIPTPTPTDPAATTNHVFAQNAGKAELLGLEIDGGVGLPMALDFSWNYALLDSEFKDSVVSDSRSGGALVPADISGNQLQNTSKHNLNIKLSQTIELDWGGVQSADWTVSANYRSKFYLTNFNNKGYGVDGSGNSIEIPLQDMPINNSGFVAATGAAPANGNFLSDEVDAVIIVNLNAGINCGEDEQYRLEGWVNNLTEETYSTKAFVNDSVNIRFLNLPRTYGVRFKASF